MSYTFTSEPITIRGRITQTVLNTFEQNTINLNLDTLSREILVVLRCDIDTSDPDSVAGAFSSCNASLANANQTSTINIDDSDCIAATNKATISDGVSSVAYANQEPESMVSSQDPLFIVATDHLYLGVNTTNAVNLKTAYFVIQARRAKANADTYAALLTSQLT